MSTLALSNSPLSTFDCIAAITLHSAGFAESTRGNLAAPVEHCPGWSVADLVWHLTEVHWMWGTIVDERLQTRPEQSRRPSRGTDPELVDDFVSGATRLVNVLRHADQSASCWTWAPQQQDVAFVTRHQVQEAAVHHWDAVHAAGGQLRIEPEVAADSVAEFLTFSVSSDEDPAEPARDPLGGSFVLRATDTGDQWLLTDGRRPGTVRVEPEGSPAATAEQAPTIEASAPDLLLWLYARTELDPALVPAPLVERFRRLCFTD